MIAGAGGVAAGHENRTHRATPSEAPRPVLKTGAGTSAARPAIFEGNAAGGSTSPLAPRPAISYPPGVWLTLTLAACTPEGVQVLADPTLTPSAAVATVATLTYETDRDVRTRVRFGAADWEVVTEADAATATHRVDLVGAPADTEVAWTLETADGEPLADGTWTTGSLPRELPPLTVSGDDLGGWLVTTLLGGTYAVLVLSPRGEVVWYHLDDSGLELVRARPAADGAGVVYTAGDVSGDAAADSRVVRVSWDGATVTSQAVPLLAQDFVQDDDGRLVSITAELRTGDDGETVKGNGLVAIEPDGAWAPLWSAWDCFDPAVTPGNDPALGWTWANAIDASADGWVLGLRNLSGLTWIDEATGACGPTLGGELSDYTFPGDRFRHAHQFEVVDDRVLVFDNDGAGGNRSRALELQLDEAAATATDVWSYLPDTGAFSLVLGDVHRYEDDTTLVDFSLAGQIDRVSPDGTVLTRVTSPLGYAFGYATVLDTPTR